MRLKVVDKIGNRRAIAEVVENRIIILDRIGIVEVNTTVCTW